MYRLLGWTNGQILSFETLKALAHQLFTGGVPAKRLLATLLSLFELFNAACWKTPVTPRGEALDISGYTLVYEDDFNGEALDEEAWYYRGLGTRRSGYNGASQVEVKDGNMFLTGEYLENGRYGPGWYTGMVALKQNYAKGYFEIRCKCNEGSGFWSAFWLQATGDPYDHERSAGGVEAVEVDIFESTANRWLGSDILESNIHCNGYDDNPDKIDSQRVGDYRVDDIHEYNTYGLLWTDEEYIFYINGVESGRSSFGKGVCRNPEELIVSLEIPETMPDDILNNQDYTTQMVVDYVRIYQLTPTAN